MITRTHVITTMSRLFLLVLSSQIYVAAQSNGDVRAIRKDIADLRRGQESIQKSLAEINASIREKRPFVPPTQVPLDVEGAPFKGTETAQVTLIEFTDYQCPFCGRHAA